MKCNNRTTARSLFGIIVLLSLPSLLSAVEEPTITANSARATGLGGGTSAAYGGGFDAVYLNPTALSEGSFSLTALEATAWVRSRPESSVPLASRAVAGPEAESALSTEETDRELKHGIGFGAAAGLGAAGGGFGLGLRAAADSFAYGQGPETSESIVAAEIGFVGGAAVPIRIGNVTVTPGVDVRPFVRLRGRAEGESSASLLARYLGLRSTVSGSAYRDAMEVLNGYGVAVNTGLRVDIGNLYVSGVLRDVGGTPLQYSVDSAGTILDSLSRFGLPVPASVGEPGYVEPGSYVIPMTLNLALGFEQQLGKWGSASAYAEFADALAFEYDLGSSLLETVEQVGRRTHAGMELGLGNVVALRGGFNRGRPTAGMGLHLGFIELDAAYSASSLLSNSKRASTPVLSVTSRIAF